MPLIFKNAAACEKFSRRFWSKVDKSAGPDGCWLWTAGRSRRGYGQFSVGCRMQRANRVSAALGGLRPLPSKCVLHSCDNPPCVNPAHLFLGTQADNMLDKARKGRCKSPRGEAHGRAKLTLAQVAEIRTAHALGAKQLALAARFAISPSTASYVVRGISYPTNN